MIDNNLKNVLLGIVIMMIALLAVAPSGREFVGAVVKLLGVLVIVIAIIAWLSSTPF